MKRWTVLTIPVLVLALVGAGGSGVGARSPGPAQDCATDALTWPQKGEAEGATFVGRVTGTWVTRNERRAFRFEVLHVNAGRIGDRIIVALDCVDTRFKVGLRYLVSSSVFVPGDGTRVRRLSFNDATSVAWRVPPGGDVRLKGYGPGTQWAEAPRYLSRPDTRREAVRAVVPS